MGISLCAGCRAVGCNQKCESPVRKYDDVCILPGSPVSSVTFVQPRFQNNRVGLVPVGGEVAVQKRMKFKLQIGDEDSQFLTAENAPQKPGNV